MKKTLPFILFLLVLSLCVSAKINYNEYNYAAASYDDTVDYLTYSLTRVQEDVIPLSNILLDLEEKIQNSSAEEISEEELDEAIVTINNSISMLNSALNATEQKITNMVVPITAETKRDNTLSGFQASKGKIESAVNDLYESSLSIQSDFVDSGYGESLLGQITDAKQGLKDILDTIYNETSLEGAQTSFDSLSHRKLELDHIQIPTVTSNVTSNAPTAEDLSETIDIQFTEQITNKTDELTVPGVFGFVKEAIKYKPYYGSLKGSEGTYEQRSGNDIDQASLLISMLRIKGINSRYVYGTVETSLSNALLWLDTKNESTLIKIFQDNGIAAELVGDKIRIEHWWVKAYVDSEWIDLDPSFAIVPKDTINVTTIGDYSFYEYSDEEMDKLFDDLEKTSEDILEEEFTEPDLSSYTTLPASLDYDIISSIAEYSSLALGERHYVTLRLYGDALLFEYETPAMNLSKLNAITFSLTSDSETIIDSMGNETPAFLLEYTPELIVSGELVASSSTILEAGKALKLEIEFSDPRQTSIESSTIVAGFTNAIVFDTGITTLNYLNKETQKFVDDYNTIDDDEKLTQTIYLTGLNYFSSLDLALEDQANMLFLNWFRPSISAIVVDSGTVKKVGSVLSKMPSVGIDRIRNVVSINLEPEQVAGYVSFKYMVITGGIASAYESEIVNYVTGIEDIISFTELKSMAYFSELGLGFAYNDPIDASLLPTPIVDQINSYSQAGLIVEYIPAPIRFNDHSYYGYLVIDPDTGDSTSFITTSHLKRGSEGIPEMIMRIIEKVYEGGEQGLNIKNKKDIASLGRYIAQIVNRALDLYHKAKFGEDLGELAKGQFGKLNTYLGKVGTFKQYLSTTDKALKALEDIEKTLKIVECALYAKETNSMYMCTAWYVTVTFASRTYDMVLSDKVALSSVPGFFVDQVIKRVLFPMWEGLGGEVCDPRYAIETNAENARKEEGKCIFDLDYTISNVGIFAPKKSKYNSEKIVAEQAGGFDGKYLKQHNQKFSNNLEASMSLDDKYYFITAEETDKLCHLGITTPTSFTQETLNPCVSKDLVGYEPALSVDFLGNVHVVYITGDHDKLNYVVFGTAAIEEAEPILIMDKSLKPQLSSSEISDDIEEAFWDNGLFIGNFAEISIKGNNIWQIDDGDYSYLVKETEQGLEVYEIEEIIIGEPNIKKTLIDLGSLIGELHYPDIATYGYDTHVTVNYNARVEYPVPGGKNSAFIMDWVAYRKIDADGTILKSDVLEGWVGNAPGVDPLLLGLGYTYMFDYQILEPRLSIDGFGNPVITSNVRTFFPSMWFMFTSQIRSIVYGGLFGGLVGGSGWVMELAQTLTHITYWDTIRTASYSPGDGVSPDENWVWATIDSNSYSLSSDLGEESFWVISNDLKRLQKPVTLLGDQITYLENHNGNYRLFSNFDGELASSVHDWKAGMDYDSENYTTNIVWQSGTSVQYYRNPEIDETSNPILVSTSTAEAKPDITVGPNGVLFVAWIDNDGKLSYSKSEDGKEWADPKQIASKPVKNFDISSGTEPGSVFVTYVDYNRDITVQSIDLELHKTTIQVKCPVNLHLYKDGKHSGILSNGSFDGQIPGVSYFHNEITDLKELVIEGDTFGMEFVMEAYDSGFVNVSVIRTGTNDGYGQTYYRQVGINSNSVGSFDLSNDNIDYSLVMDYDGEGSVDEILQPNYVPFVEINSPNSFIYQTTDTINLNATTFDVEDSVIGIVTWSSNISGHISVSNPISFNLPYGFHEITSSVEDSEGEKAQDSITIFVDDQVAPVITLNSVDSGNTNVVHLDYLVDEGIRKATALFSNGESFDLETDQFVFDLALLNVTNGSYFLTLSVEDLAGNPSEATSPILLAIDNHAPVLDYILDVEVFRNETVDIDASGYDLDDDTLTFSYGALLDGDGVWQTTLSDTGVYYSTISVSDGTLSDSQIVKVEVKDRKPIFDPTPNVKVLTYGILVEFDVNAVDPEGEPVEYSMDGPEGATLTGNHFSWTPTQYQVKNHVVTLYATDGVVKGKLELDIAVSDPSIACNFDYECGESDILGYCKDLLAYRKGNMFVCKNAGTPASYCDLEYVDEFIIECPYDCVKGVCTSIPIVQDIIDIEVDENENVIVIVNASDADDDTITYTINSPKFTQDENIFTWNTTYDDFGRYRFTVTVSDGSNTIGKQFNVLVNNVNRAPIVPVSQQFDLTQSIFFSSTVDAVDPDGDALTYSLIPEDFSLNPYTGELTINPKHEDVGTHNLILSVSDKEFSVNGSLMVNIDDINDAPKIDFIPPQTAQVNVSFSYQVIASDMDNDVLLYFDNTTLFDIDSDGLIQFVPTQSDVGAHMVLISVDDGSETTTQLMHITIVQDGVSVLDKFHDIIVNEGSFVDLWQSIGGQP